MNFDPALLIRRYDEVWADANQERRLSTLEDIWHPEGLYVDPDVPGGVRGPHALCAFIDESFSSLPGLTITAASGVQVMGDRGFYRWRATIADGSSFEGTDFIEFSSDGRIIRVTNFYDE